MTRTSHAHGRGDARGSAYDRWARKAWLLSPAAGFGGNGRRVPCHHCGRSLTHLSLTVDRYPICGHAGGRYVRGNIVPACERCNRGAHPAGRCRAGATGPVQIEMVAREVAHG